MENCGLFTDFKIDSPSSGGSTSSDSWWTWSTCVFTGITLQIKTSNLCWCTKPFPLELHCCYGFYFSTCYYLLFKIDDINITGYVVMVINIFMYASPLEKFVKNFNQIEVIKTKKNDLVPIATSFAGIYCCITW